METNPIPSRYFLETMEPRVPAKSAATHQVAWAKEECEERRLSAAASDLIG